MTKDQFTVTVEYRNGRKDEYTTAPQEYADSYALERVTWPGVARVIVREVLYILTPDPIHEGVERDLPR